MVYNGFERSGRLWTDEQNIVCDDGICEGWEKTKMFVIKVIPLRKTNWRNGEKDLQSTKMNPIHPIRVTKNRYLKEKDGCHEKHH